MNKTHCKRCGTDIFTSAVHCYGCEMAIWQEMSNPKVTIHNAQLPVNAGRSNGKGTYPTLYHVESLGSASLPGHNL